MQPKSHVNILIGASGPAEVLFNACWPHTEIFLPETHNICVDKHENGTCSNGNCSKVPGSQTFDSALGLHSIYFNAYSRVRRWTLLPFSLVFLLPKGHKTTKWH